MTQPVDFASIFQTLPGNYIILLPDAPRYTIVAFNKVRADETFTTEAHIGMGIFEAFPDNPNDPNANGVAMLTASLDMVLRERKPHHMAVQKYDIQTADHTGFEVRYWLPRNIPVLNNEGEVSYIIHCVQDVTAQIKAEQRETMTRQNFEDFFNQANTPFAVLTGAELRFTYVNPAYAILMNNRDLVGRTVAEAIPGLMDQTFVRQMQEVVSTGRSYHGIDVPTLAHFGGDDESSIRFFNLSYTPFHDERGRINGVLAYAHDVTAQQTLFNGVQ